MRSDDQLAFNVSMVTFELHSLFLESGDLLAIKIQQICSKIQNELLLHSYCPQHIRLDDQ